ISRIRVKGLSQISVDVFFMGILPVSSLNPSWISPSGTASRRDSARPTPIVPKKAEGGQAEPFAKPV
ncbi:MAG: hypothetical protein J6U01_01445, partial [Clostridia bacterium]|nr:hypothetical protein [Clostridia bacterium]